MTYEDTSADFRTGKSDAFDDTETLELGVRIALLERQHAFGEPALQQIGSNVWTNI